MKRAGPLKARARLRPISAKARALRARDAEQVAEEGQAFYNAIKGRVCAVCGRTEAEARRAGTRHQAHHAIRKEILKRSGLRAYLWDPRGAVCVCEEPCHRRHTDGVRKIPLAGLGEETLVFARELGLEYVLEREYGL